MSKIKISILLLLLLLLLALLVTFSTLPGLMDRKMNRWQPTGISGAVPSWKAKNRRSQKMKAKWMVSIGALLLLAISGVSLAQDEHTSWESLSE